MAYLPHYDWCCKFYHLTVSINTIQCTPVMHHVKGFKELCMQCRPVVPGVIQPDVMPS